MNNLKPCPFCGGTDLRMGEAHEAVYVNCPDCDTDGPMRHTDQEAITAWNTRAEGIDELTEMDENTWKKMSDKLKTYPQSFGLKT